jgi:hypothetical protein
MDNIERKLEETRQKLDKEVGFMSSKVLKTSRLTWLSSLLVISVLAIGIFIGREYLKDLNVRLVSIESEIKNRSSEPSNVTPVTTNEFNSRLSSVETLMEAIANMSSKALEQMNFIFAIVAGFFGLFSIFFAVRQFMSDGGKEKHDAEMIELVGSFRQNITVVNDLMKAIIIGIELKTNLEN